MPPRAIIVGAGIGGLSAAIALSQAGFRVSIYERARTLEEFGAGLQLTPNATRILSRLGVLKQVLPFAARPNAVVVLRGSDDVELTRMRLDDAERRWGAAYLMVHRADLQRELLEAIRGRRDVELSLGATVLGFVNNGGRVSVVLTSGEAQTLDHADLLVGADGVHSRIRDLLGFGGQNQAEFTGRVAYRAILNTADADLKRTRSNIILRLGRRAHLVQYPLRGGSMVNLVATIQSARPAGSVDHEANRVGNRLNLERALRGWSKEARAMTSAPIQWRVWPLYSRPPISSFSVGRVTLVGDAAHPMAPFLAQGAAQAIEDAGALGRILAEAPEIPAALSTYSRERTARTARVQREALKLGRIYHMSGPMAFARDMTMRLLESDGLTARYNWLYGA